LLSSMIFLRVIVVAPEFQPPAPWVTEPLGIAMLSLNRLDIGRNEVNGRLFVVPMGRGPDPVRGTSSPPRGRSS
jgi:hypothetical protein